jgi:hypothetical protein
MSIWSRLFNLRSPYSSPPPLDTLVEEPRRSATWLGATPLISPWSTSRLIAILRRAQSDPTPLAFEEARLARQCLSQFWLQAPVDQLEFLYGSAIGDCYRLLLSSGLSEQPLLPEEQTWRRTLAERLSASFERPETPNLLLGLMPYFPPGKMRVEDPQRQVPAWLLQDYARLFDPALLARVWQPAGLLNPVGQSYGPAPGLGMRGPAQPAQPAQPALPRLTQQRGAEALAIVQDPDFQRRMSGLINLFVIDPNDAQVLAQLAELRRLLGQIWLDAQPAQMEALYSSPQFGRLYQELLASGFSRVLFQEEDRFLRNQLAAFVADMSAPGSLNALMAVLPFYPPGKIAFGGGEQHLPAWLRQQMATLYGSQLLGEASPEPSPNPLQGIGG